MDTADIKHGTTTVVRSAEQAIREELFMERSRSRRALKTLHAQLDKARRRRFKSTLVPLDVLEQLLTKLENVDS